MKRIALLALAGWVVAVAPANAQTYTVTTIGGMGRLPYSGDGQSAATVDLFSPTRIAFDRAGNLYFTEAYYGRVFRLDAAGKLKAIAGNGDGVFSGQGGPATAAGLGPVGGIAVDAAGNVYFGASDRICKVGADGVLRVIAGNGTYGYSGDGGQALAATIAIPEGIAPDTSGAIYFSDWGHHVVRKIGADGVVTTVAGTGAAGYNGDNQPGVSSQLNTPEGIALDSDGNLYIADRFNYRVRKVRRDGFIFTAAGNGQAGSSGEGSDALRAVLNQPEGVALDKQGRLFIADTTNNLVKRVDPDGRIFTVNRNTFPSDVAVDANDCVAAVDWIRHVVYRASCPDNNLTLLAGTVRTTAIGDNGPADRTVFLDPTGVAVDGQGNVYVADSSDQRVRRIGKDLKVTTVAGNGIFGTAAENALAVSAPVGIPRGIAVDAVSGKVFFTNGCQVRSISTAGRNNLAAGTSECAYSGDNTLASGARLNFPRGLATDAQGNLYISDTGNHRIRRLTPNFTITTLAGSGEPGYSGNQGDALAAKLDTPVGIAVDARGNVYFGDTNNHRVRKIDRNGVISDYAGNGQAGNSGDGGPATAARLFFPNGIALDAAGNLFIGSSPYIRRVAPDGRISTVAGNGSMAFSGDGGPALLAGMDPFHLAVDRDGRIYFSDDGNLRVRRLDPAQTPPPVTPPAITITGVTHAATFQAGPVAPGELVTVFGTGMGPVELVQASADPSGSGLPTRLAGARILFDGVEAPLLYVSATQSSAIVPLAVAGKSSTVVQVTYSDSKGSAAQSAPVTLQVAQSVPGLFTADSSGSGQASAFNQDFSVNSASAPSARGDVVMLFGTGGGLANPPGTDGQLTVGAPELVLPVAVTFGGVPADVKYKGAAPNLVTGVFQINAVIPLDAPAGNVPVVVKVGAAASPSTVTVAVR